jgi:hypothetical protein
MELKEVLRFADDKVFSKTGKHLDDLQEAILKEALQGRKYATKVAQDRDCSEVMLGLLLLNYGRYYQMSSAKKLAR